jgi:hypothetical protein
VSCSNAARLLRPLATVESEAVDDVGAEGLLQGRVVAVGGGAAGFMLLRGDVDRQAPPVMACEEELPLRIRRLGDPGRQHVGERRRLCRRRRGAAALADDAHDGAAVADVIVEIAQRGVAARLLPEVALHPQQRLTRAQVGRDGIARPAELAGDRREEDAELRHNAGDPG